MEMILGAPAPRIFIGVERQKNNQKLMVARRELIAVCRGVQLQSGGRSPRSCSLARPIRAVRNYAPFDSNVKPYRRPRILPARDKIVGEAMKSESEPGRQIAGDLQAHADLDDNWCRPSHITSPPQVESVTRGKTLACAGQR